MTAREFGRPQQSWDSRILRTRLTLAWVTAAREAFPDAKHHLIGTEFKRIRLRCWVLSSALIFSYTNIFYHRNIWFSNLLSIHFECHFHTFSFSIITIFLSWFSWDLDSPQSKRTEPPRKLEVRQTHASWAYSRPLWSKMDHGKKTPCSRYRTYVRTVSMSFSYDWR